MGNGGEVVVVLAHAACIWMGFASCVAGVRRLVD